MQSHLTQVNKFLLPLVGVGMMLSFLACSGQGSPVGFGGSPMSGTTHAGGIAAPVTDGNTQGKCHNDFTMVKIKGAAADPNQIPVFTQPIPPIKVKVSGQLLTNCLVAKGASLSGRYVRLVGKKVDPKSGVDISYNVYVDSPLNFSDVQGNTFEAVIDTFPLTFDYVNDIYSNLDIYLVPEGFSGISLDQKNCSNPSVHCFDEMEGWSTLIVVSP